ncbi:MAG TPA: hypothetical protein VGG33_01515 [Polyangia bacterium]
MILSRDWFAHQANEHVIENFLCDCEGTGGFRNDLNDERSDAHLALEGQIDRSPNPGCPERVVQSPPANGSQDRGQNRSLGLSRLDGPWRTPRKREGRLEASGQVDRAPVVFQPVRWARPAGRRKRNLRNVSEPLMKTLGDQIAVEIACNHDPRPRGAIPLPNEIRGILGCQSTKVGHLSHGEEAPGLQLGKESRTNCAPLDDVAAAFEPFGDLELDRPPFCFKALRRNRGSFDQTLSQQPKAKLDLIGWKFLVVAGRIKVGVGARVSGQLVGPLAREAARFEMLDQVCETRLPRRIVSSADVLTREKVHKGCTLILVKDELDSILELVRLCRSRPHSMGLAIPTREDRARTKDRDGYDARTSEGPLPSAWVHDEIRGANSLLAAGPSVQLAPGNALPGRSADALDLRARGGGRVLVRAFGASFDRAHASRDLALGGDGRGAGGRRRGLSARAGILSTGDAVEQLVGDDGRHVDAVFDPDEFDHFGSPCDFVLGFD